MFASTFPSRSNPGLRQMAGLYQQVAVESQLAGATPHGLVAMLFDGYMQAIAQARGALRDRDMVAKGEAIGRAVRILEEGLRAGLDLRAGGSLAVDLNDLYTYLARRLTLGNLRNDDAAFVECQNLMLPLQEAWASISDQVGGAAPAARVSRPKP